MVGVQLHRMRNFWCKLGVVSWKHGHISAPIFARRLCPDDVCRFWSQDAPVKISDDAKVHVNFDLLWNGDAFTLGQTGSDVQGRPVQLERMDCFVGAFELHDTEQGWMDIDTIARIDFADAEPHTVLNLVTDGDLQIDGLRMGLGVPADLNKGRGPSFLPLGSSAWRTRILRHALGLGGRIHLQHVRRAHANKP